MDKKTGRTIKHQRVRAKISGSSSRPRLAVFRSSKHMQLQLVNDQAGRTLAGFSSMKIKGGNKTERAQKLGREAAKKILETGIKKVVFDRGGYRYQGRVRALAEALRGGGLEF